MPVIDSLVSTAELAWQNLTAVSVGLLAAALAFHLGKLLAESRAWHGILAHADGGERVRFRTTCAAFVSAIGANVVLPARTGETLRIGLVRHGAPDVSMVTVVATIVLETTLEVIFGVIVIVAAIATGAAAARSSPIARAAGLLTDPRALALAAAIVLGLICLGRLLRGRLRAALVSGAAGFAIIRSPSSFLTRVLVWKLVAWALRFAAVFAFLAAFHLPATLWTAAAVVAAQNIAASLPLLPGNAGTQQAAIALALAGTTASSASVIGFGVGMQAATVALDVVVGVLALTLALGARGTLDFISSRRGTMSLRRSPAQSG
jgi:uncharacterized membrane protein YbhN (UPF0104 family)